MPTTNLDISYSFGKLRRLLDTFSSLAEGRPPQVTTERRAVRWAEDLGPVAVPMLARKLRSERESEASWAYFLLSQIGGERAASAARDLALEGSASDSSKALALALLSELGAEIPEAVKIQDSRALREKSVRELLESLAAPADVARAADLLLEQVESDDLPGFLSDMVDVAGSQTAPLVDELLLRDDVSPEAAEKLRSLRDRFGASAPPRPRRAGRRGRVFLGEHADGSRVLAVFGGFGRHNGADRPSRRRALVCHLRRGRLASTRYEAALTPRAGERRILLHLTSQGYTLGPAREDEASTLLLGALRAERRSEAKLPREFYLGRDLLGLYDEHVRSPRATSSDVQQLARALTLLEDGEAARAHRLFERYVEAYPDDPEGRTGMGSCLLALERVDEAQPHFAAAARLAPHDPIGHWNLSHVAKRAGKLGACYLALTRYLALKDRAPGAAERLESARSYMRLFERFAELEHGESTVENVARAEELFERAYQHLVEGRTVDAVGGFEAVLKLVPSHYPSWGNLGVAHMTLHERERAELCLKKALEYRPDYELARKNLVALSD